jgi:hypothetical protein
MKMRALRRRPTAMYLHGPWHRGRRVLGKYVVVRVFENVGHDEHNCWTEYLILRFK